jgi:hypothetical protein
MQFKEVLLSLTRNDPVRLTVRQGSQRGMPKGRRGKKQVRANESEGFQAHGSEVEPSSGYLEAERSGKGVRYPEELD